METIINDRYRMLSVIQTDECGTLYHTFDEKDGVEGIALYLFKKEAIKYHTTPKNLGVKKTIPTLEPLYHPNLIPIDSWGVTEKGFPFYCMRWRVQKILDPEEDPLNLSATLKLMFKICHALDFLHHKGFVHGSLKPSTIAFGEEDIHIYGVGQTLAIKHLYGLPHMFSPSYTAPEIFQGKALDHLSDLYSLGAIGYAFLTSHPPSFHSDTRKDKTITPRTVLEEKFAVPSKVSTLIHSLLSPKPSRRFQSAAKTAFALNEMIGKKAILKSLNLKNKEEPHLFRGGFLGREKELEMLQQMMQSPTCNVILVSGLSGVGKSCLIQVFTRQGILKKGLVLKGHCIEAEGLAYRPFREILRQMLPILEREYQNTHTIDDTQWAVLASLIPELCDHPITKEIPSLEALDQAATQQRLNNTILHILRLSAKARPTTIIIEDLQWADESSQTLLKGMTSLSWEDDLLVIADYQVKQDDAAYISGEYGGVGLEHLPLKPFLRKDVSNLIGAILSWERVLPIFLETVYDITRGNLLFTTSLIRYLAQKGKTLRPSLSGWVLHEETFKKEVLPEKMEGVVRLQLDLLSENSRAVLEISAIMGPVFWDGALENISRFTKDDITIALQEALQQELIIENPISSFVKTREFIFTHSVIQKVTSQLITPDNQRPYHVRFAAWLREVSERRFDKYLGMIADHLEKAGRIDEAKSYLIQAGEQAASQFENSQAIAYLDRTLKLIPKDDWVEHYAILSVREKVNSFRGDCKEQVKDLAKLEGLAESLDDDQRRIDFCTKRSGYRKNTGDYSGSIDDSKRMIAISTGIHDIKGLASGYYNWADTQWRQGNYKSALPKMEQTISITRAAGIFELETNALRAIGNIYIRLGDYSKALAFGEDALKLDRRNGNRDMESIQLMNIALFLSALGDYEKAENYLSDALKLAKKIGYIRTEMMVLSNWAEIKTLLGDFKTALTYAKWAYQIALDINHRRLQAYASMYIGDSLHGLMRLKTANEAFKIALALKLEQEMHFEAMKIRTSMADIALKKGDRDTCGSLVKTILSFEEEHTLIGASEPFRVYGMLYQVLNGLGDKRAHSILKKAVSLLMEKAGMIKEEAFQKCYLENIIAHQVLLKTYSEEFFEEPSLKAPFQVDTEKTFPPKEKTKSALIQDIEKARHENSELKTLSTYYSESDKVLWESEKRFRAISENAMDAVIIFDEKENVLFWNQAACDIFGYTLNERRHRLLISLLTRKIKEGFQREIAQANKGDFIGSIRKSKVIEGVRNDGSEFPLEISFSTWKKEKTTLFSAIGRDISERKQFERALEAAKAKAESANREMIRENRRLHSTMERVKQMVLKADHASRAKSEFIASMSHEIRTPMNAIMGMTHLSLNTDLDSMQRSHLNTIQTSSQDLLRAIDTLLDFSRIETGHLRLENIAFNLRTLMEEVADAIAEKVQGKAFEITARIKWDVPLNLIGDPIRLRQILLNLGENSIKEMLKGHFNMVCVLKFLKEEVAVLQFSVMASAAAGHQDQKNRWDELLFAKGKRKSNGYDSDAFGLSVSEQLVEKMGGKIWVDGKLNEENAFHFTVKVMRDKRCIELKKGHESESQKTLNCESRSFLKEESLLNILLVEDNRVNQMMASRLLEKLGHRVRVAENGKIALELIREAPFDLVFMDIEMPEMDGIEATRRIRELPEGLCDIPIVAVTAYAMKGYREKCFSVGMNDYMIKPIDPEILKEMTIKWGIGETEANRSEKDYCYLTESKGEVVR